MKKTAPKPAQAETVNSPARQTFIEWLDSMPDVPHSVVEQNVNLSLFTSDWMLLAEIAKAEDCSVAEAIEIVLGFALVEVANGDAVGTKLFLERK